MRYSAWSCLVGHLALVCTSDVANAQTEGDLITSFGIAFKPHLELSQNVRSVDVTKPFPQDNPRYYRLRIKVENPDREDWTVSVRSPAGQVLSAFDQTEVTCEDETGCWTKRLNSRLPTVQLATSSQRVRAKIVDGLYMPDKAPLPFYSPIEGSEIEPLTGMSFASRDEKISMYSLADSLGMFIASGFTTSGETANWCCSGVRLTKDLFMTNWHCGASKNMPDSAYWKKDSPSLTCQAGIVDMSWDVDDVGREYSCESVVFESKNLDVAILRLGSLADGPDLIRPLQTPLLSASTALAGQEVMILHHPACEPKSITRGCSVLDSNVAQWTSSAGPMTEFSYNCTTENGSSGAPVFAGKKVVGLHHLGVDPARGRGNFAVSMPSILKAIHDADEALYGEISSQIQ